MFFGKQKLPKSFANNIFPEIFKIFSKQILNFLKILQFYHVRAPSPQVGPPFLLFLGVLHPAHTPQVARPCMNAWLKYVCRVYKQTDSSPKSMWRSNLCCNFQRSKKVTFGTSYNYMLEKELVMAKGYT
jgi:hypothetical protein